MKYDKKIEGKYVTLRAVDPNDAQATLDMRLDPKSSGKFFHEVDCDIERQADWIRAQHERPGDWFFIAEDKTGKPVGTIGMCEVVGTRGHSSRLIGVGNAFQSFEIQMLILDWGFEYLKLTDIWGNIDEDNEPAIKFAKYFGWKFKEPVVDEETGRRVLYLDLTRDDYEQARKKLVKMIYRS